MDVCHRDRSCDDHDFRCDRRAFTHTRAAESLLNLVESSASTFGAPQAALPIAKLLVAVGNILAPGRGFRDGPFATEVELRELVDIASERGIVERDERRMIQSVFDLASTSARSVMVPRPEMLWIEADKTAGQATSLCVRSGHSRLPVVGDDVDDIVGVVYLTSLQRPTIRRMGVAP